ncbi:MAG TPA: SWIM zinc finger family protein [Terriglobia bacterium]|nr:SWIM zinc finger family protein [Terriglobia bacterium]
MAKISLETALQVANLKRMAGAESFSRGRSYYDDGQVRDLSRDDNLITAWVSGTLDYRVELWVEADEFDYSCTCPIGQDGNFCKHCVAAALAALEGSRREARRAPKAEREVTLKDVREMLVSRDREALADLFLGWAKTDDRLRERLLLAAAKEAKAGVNLTAFRRAISKALDAGDFVDYHGMASYARDADEVIDQIEALQRDGHAEAAIELSEHALKCAERSMDSMDDSDGYMGGILERLQEIHYRACVEARPDPVALAEKLFAWEMSSDWEVFLGAAARYSKVLGAGGLAAYRKLAEAKWAKVPARGPGARDSGAYESHFRITSIMEALAGLTRDVEARVAVMSRDLSTAYNFLRIAETYKQAGKRDKALEWAERGVREFPKQTDSRLREFLADEYHHRKRHEEAMQLVWANFSDQHSLGAYQNLAGHAERAGAWQAWRERALAEIRSGIEARKRTERPRAGYWGSPFDCDVGRSTLVEVFLYEKDLEAAWREAQEGGCSDHLWLELAKLRENDHPEDAVKIYLQRVDPLVQRTNNEAYEEAVSMLRKVQRLTTRLGQQAEFKDRVTLLRATYKPKRNFIKLLDGAGL